MDLRHSSPLEEKKDYIYLHISFYAPDYALQEVLIKMKNRKKSSSINVTRKSDTLIVCLFPSYLSYSPTPNKKFSSWTEDTAVLWCLLSSPDGPSEPRGEPNELNRICKKNCVYRVTKMLWKYKLSHAVIISFAVALIKHYKVIDCFSTLAP